MPEEKREIVWNKKAAEQFVKIINFISESCPKEALKVRDNIQARIDETIFFPFRYKKDSLKKNNDGSFRYFEQYRYRVSIRITESQIRILRVRHTSRYPRQF